MPFQSLHSSIYLFSMHKADRRYCRRRLARRGGIKRISAGIYDEIRNAMKNHLTDASIQPLILSCVSNVFLQIIKNAVTYTEYQNRKTCTVTDVSIPSVPDLVLY